MAADAHANFATSLIAVAPSPATSGTTATVTTGDGSLFPTTPFNAVICPATTAPTKANAEIVRVTTIAGDGLTFTRTQESTSARTVIVGDQIFAAITKKTLTDAEAIYPDMQNGVMLATDSVLSGTAISGGGTITGTLAAANPIWITTAAGTLPFTFAGASLSVPPGTKPASGQYRGYGIEVNTDGTVTLATGSADQASLALALANINTVPAAGKLRVADVVMLNTAGTYSLPASATRDRRPWARGAYSRQQSTAGPWTTTSTSLVAIDSTNLSQRLECSGVTVRVRLAGTVWGTAACQINFNMYVDGAAQDGATVYQQAIGVGTNVDQVAPVTYDFVGLAAGSHLFVPFWSTSTSTAHLQGDSTHPIQFIIEEVVRANANNGTA